MTQILSGISSEGIMVATDSMATTFDSNGEKHHFVVDKLFPVGSHAFIVSGGMGISVELSRRFKQHAEERRLVGIEAIIAAAGAHLSEQYRMALIEGGIQLERHDQLERIYFVVGGYSFRSQDVPYQLAVWGSEAGQLPLQRIGVGASVMVPRALSGEVKLSRLCNEDRPLEEIMAFAREFLQNLAASNPDVGPPFRFGTVTPSGFTKV
ncbi:MAG: hypothetical protein JSU72_14315 [Deltaproteobacteria bacterium]|nr:MAG: hypothetical protein JSU72_14315 [Deltaproteobacteria bacterium]